MAIAIHVEVSSRELDSKLLLAVIAAARGHSVVVGDVIMGARLKLLPPSVFHTKDMGPSEMVIKRHQEILRRGHKITNQDEEASLVRYEDDSPTTRYAEETMADVSAVFCWGESARNAMVDVYPHYAEKISLTGSPRADLWSPQFAQYWRQSADFPEVPFLLVSSNMGDPRISLTGTLSIMNNARNFERNKHLGTDFLQKTSERYRAWASFVEAITELSEGADGYKIIIRPHPVENPEAWKILLAGLPNVEVIREGAISGWLNASFALLHNGCTSALEATLAGKPIISYSNFDQQDLKLSNDLGTRANNLDELKALVEHHWSLAQSEKAYEVPTKDKQVIERKIHTQEDELAASRIVDVWDGLVPKNSLGLPTVWAFRLLLLAKYVRDHVFTVFLPKKRKNTIAHTKEKFPTINFRTVKKQVGTLEELVGLDHRVRVKRIGERAVLITPSPKSGTR